MKGKRKRTLKGWADLGSHGRVFEFIGGPVGERYPNLLQIYSKKSPGLVPVTITYAWEPSK